MSSTPTNKRSVVTLLQEFSIPLLLGVVVALVWANADAAGYARMMHWEPIGYHLNLHFFANDILMVFFFGIAAKEITEAALPGGDLNPPRKAVNPLMATFGGVLGPVAVFLLATVLLDAPEIRRGWGIPTATDIALAWLVARMVFGARHPAVSFLLLLAVADDAIGLGIIAVFYPDPAHPVAPLYLLCVVAAMGLALFLNRRRVMSFWPYLAAGALSWFGLHQAHLHPALALVPVVPFMPNRGRDLGLFQERADGHYSDTLNRFEHFFKTPVDFGLFVFGLANAGVAMSSVGAATTSVLLALVVGKTVGITAFSLAAHALGFSLPSGMKVRDLVTAALTASLGLTVALFVAGVAFAEPELQGAAKMGALMTAGVAPLVLILGRILGIERKHVLDAGVPAPLVSVSGRSSFRGRKTADQEEINLGPHTGPGNSDLPER
ncbi:MAG TPA: sodium:proton antiporter [Sorangium sp.]|nr:sodium:proton antiporter [Sorangium sp.]